MARGERPIKPGDSWFSQESYLGSASMDEYYWGKSTVKAERSSDLPTLCKLNTVSTIGRHTAKKIASVRRGEEATQTAKLGPKSIQLSETMWEGSDSQEMLA